MMQGCIDYLLGDTDEARILREKFIFKVGSQMYILSMYKFRILL